jgi:hypothetical protein
MILETLDKEPADVKAMLASCRIEAGKVDGKRTYV